MSASFNFESLPESSVSLERDDMMKAVGVYRPLVFPQNRVVVVVPNEVVLFSRDGIIELFRPDGWFNSKFIRVDERFSVTVTADKQY